MVTEGKKRVRKSPEERKREIIAAAGKAAHLAGAMAANTTLPVVGIPVFFLIVIVGHAFNIGLNVIGTYVHTSRLQYLEFFKQFYAEGGRPWRPLNIATKYVDIKEEE